MHQEHKSPPTADPPRWAIYLSALVWPGAGQYVQKRWRIGTFYAAAFLVGAVFLFTEILRPLFWNLQMLTEYSGRTETFALRPIVWGKVLFWLCFSMLVYLGALLDAVIYSRRQPKQD